MNLRADLAIRLVEERQRLQYSQADFAVKVGMSREGLRLYETGQRSISAEFLAEATALGLDSQYVLTGIRSANIREVEQRPASAVMIGAGNGHNVVGVVQSGGTVINTTRHITRTVAEVRPGAEHISEDQAATLTRLVGDVVALEAQVRQSPKSHRAVWAALNAHCRVTRYRLIRAEDFGVAQKYLHQWLGRLNSSPKAAEGDTDQWRKRRYAYIKINSAADPVAVDEYLRRNFKKASLTDLTNEELEKVYRYVASRKRAPSKVE